MSTYQSKSMTSKNEEKFPKIFKYLETEGELLKGFPLNGRNIFFYLVGESGVVLEEGTKPSDLYVIVNISSTDIQKVNILEKIFKEI